MRIIGLAFIGLIIAVVFSVAAAFFIAKAVGCGGAKDLLSFPFDPCIEFWLNRYQQLFAGWLALVLAAIGAGIVWQQNRILTRQADEASLGLQKTELRDLRVFSDISQAFDEVSTFSGERLRALGELDVAPPQPGNEPRHWQQQLQRLAQLIDDHLRGPLIREADVSRWSTARSEIDKIAAALQKPAAALDAANSPFAPVPRLRREPGEDDDQYSQRVLAAQNAEQARRRALLTEFQQACAAVPLNIFTELQAAFPSLKQSIRDHENELGRSMARLNRRILAASG